MATTGEVMRDVDGSVAWLPLSRLRSGRGTSQSFPIDCGISGKTLNRASFRWKWAAAHLSRAGNHLLGGQVGCEWRFVPGIWI
jgi:hypothetical protein